MATINGTDNNDTLTVQTDTTSVQAGTGTDTVVFSGNYADYIFSQSETGVPLMTNNTTGQVVSLHRVQYLKFEDRIVELQEGLAITVLINTETYHNQNYSPITTLANSGGDVVGQLESILRLYTRLR